MTDEENTLIKPDPDDQLVSSTGATRARHPNVAAAVLRDTRAGLPIVRSLLRTSLRAGFFISAVLSGVLFTFAVLYLSANGFEGRSPIWQILFLLLLLVDAAGCIGVVVFDYSTHLPQANRVARITLIAIVATLLIDVITNGFRFPELFYIFQLGCIIWFQVSTDRQLARNEKFHSPWAISTDQERRDYIPLNFFNIFWVFVVASVAGLIVEVIWHALTTGGYEDRAGMLWGPFSPIYGFGAVLMTIALNRWWNHSKVIIFLVAGLIGAAFEFFVSWLMEAAFGITAWDYSGTFLNIDGRTNFAFFCAWGLLGLVWIKLLLPDVLKIVDAIPLRLRAVLTIIVAMFMLANAMMTLITIDRWYGRLSGVQATNVIERYVDQHYDDAYMAHRFQTMKLDPEKAQRAGG